MSATPPTNTLYIVTGYWNDDHRNPFDGYYMYDGSKDDCPVPDDEIFYYGHPAEDGHEFTIPSFDAVKYFNVKIFLFKTKLQPR